MAYPRPQRTTGPGGYSGLFKSNMGNYSNQKFGFFSTPQPIVSTPMMPPRFTRPEFAPTTPACPTVPPVTISASRPPRPQRDAPPPAVPITTVFVGNITEKCSDELIQKILTLCGSINNWKRLQDTNGKFSPFGFCDFDHPEGTMRALRILNEFHLGDKKLTVKADEQTSKMLEEFSHSREVAHIADNQPGPDGEEIKTLTDEETREKIQELIQEDNPELLNAKLASDKPPPPCKQRSRSSSTSSSTSSTPSTRSRSGSKGIEKIARKSSPSAEGRHHRHGGDSKDKGAERGSRREKRRRPSGTESSTSSASSRSSRASRTKRSRHSNKSKGGRRHRSPSRESVDSEELRDRRRIRKEIKEKEESYLRRLEKWEQREKRMARQYDKDEEADLQRKKMMQREARKLKQFLEDYEDERDDPKYYKSSNLFQRKRNYEKEREADAKDRQEELQEIEELKRQILADNHGALGDAEAEQEAQRLHEANEKTKLKHLRSHSGSPTPHRPLGHATTVPADANNRVDRAQVVKIEERDNEKGDWSSIDNGQQHADKEAPKPEALAETILPSKPVVATIQKQSLNSNPSRLLNGVFGEDDEDDSVHQIKKKIKPFEITKEDRIQSLTPEERKKLIKELIEKIPTSRDELFIFALCWQYVDPQLVEQRIKPWVSKKISEYIGEEEPSLVTFICEKVANRTDPKKILSDLAMVLDDEAEVFMVKLWRLIIYESEAKRLGLSSSSSTVTASTSVSKPTPSSGSKA